MEARELRNREISAKFICGKCGCIIRKSRYTRGCGKKVRIFPKQMRVVIQRDLQSSTIIVNRFSRLTTSGADVIFIDDVCCLCDANK